MRQLIPRVQETLAEAASSLGTRVEVVEDATLTVAGTTAVIETLRQAPNIAALKWRSIPSGSPCGSSICRPGRPGTPLLPGDGPRARIALSGGRRAAGPRAEAERFMATWYRRTYGRGRRRLLTVCRVTVPANYAATLVGVRYRLGLSQQQLAATVGAASKAVVYQAGRKEFGAARARVYNRARPARQNGNPV